MDGRVIPLFYSVFLSFKQASGIVTDIQLYMQAEPDICGYLIL